MRIMFMSTAVYDHGYVDTAAIHLREVVTNLLDEHQIFVVAQLEAKINPGRNLNITEITVPGAVGRSIEVDSKPLLAIFYRILVAASSLIAGCRVTLSFKPNLIYVRHGVNSLGALILSLFSRLPLVVEVNAIFSEEAVLVSWPKAVASIADIIDKLTFRHATGAIVATQGYRKKLQEKYHVDSSRITVIPVGANLDLFKPVGKELVRKELDLSPDDKIVCFVGNLIKYQGVSYLVRSAPAIMRKIPCVKFLIVGDGPIKDELVDEAKNLGVINHFIFKGRVPYEDVPKYINASDVCIAIKKRLPSGFSSMKLFEYMSCEKPVVATVANGTDVVRESNAGILVDPENSAEVADAITTLLLDEKMREEMGKRGRQVVVEKNSWKIVAQQISEACKRAIEYHSNRSIKKSS